MKNFLNKLNTTALRGYVRAQNLRSARENFSMPTGRLERAAFYGGGICGGMMTVGGTALAACSGGGSSLGSLTSFMASAANFAIAFGAAGSVMMLAIGAMFIMFGGTPDRVRRGMTIIKNSVIGLGVLASGMFVKFVIVNFVLGATSGHNGADKSCFNYNGSVA